MIAVVPDAHADDERIAGEVLSALDGGYQIAPLSAGDPGLDVAGAYRVTAAVRRLRERRGERVIGRKIGFTNRTIWPEYGVYAPIWGYVYDTTVHRLADLDSAFDLARLPEPRIEPEIIFALARAPEPGMDEAALMACMDWVGHGFEIVQSIYPAWRFEAPDTIAGFGLHGALVTAGREAVTSTSAQSWRERLATFTITLMRNGVAADHGHAGNVLGGGPVAALRHLVELLARDADSPPLEAGEIISTGTLTRALPIAPDECWSTRLDGLPLGGIEVCFR